MQVEFKNPKVEREIEELVRVAKEVIPSIKEIRLFGSYNNGNWNPESSDIDINIEIASKNYSEINGNIYKRIREKLNGEYKDRFNIFFCTHPVKWSIFNLNNARVLYRNNLLNRIFTKIFREIN